MNFLQQAYEKAIFGVDKIARIAPLYKPSNEVYPLGIKEFDKAMDGGIRNGELITISGQTGQGKTLWSQVLTKNLSDKGIPSLWFSYEMDCYYLAQRFQKIMPNESLYDLSAHTPVEMTSGKLDWIEQQIQEGIKKQAIKVVFIDHLHYLIDLNSSLNSSLLIGAIVRELKKMAIKNKVIIFLIAHTKKVYQDEKLDLSSIRDSSLISQESDYVLLVERLKKEKTRMELLEKKATGTEWSNQTRVKLAKNRRTGNLFYLDFNYNNGNLIPINKNYEQPKFK